ncbi:hypothetical protein PQX77_005262 [Marasmius sp. AFHP31]|nr:hypothetical protein PQX77_005262 [Marasmius sp. AFHP31]
MERNSKDYGRDKDQIKESILLIRRTLVTTLSRETNAEANYNKEVARLKEENMKVLQEAQNALSERDEARREIAQQKKLITQQRLRITQLEKDLTSIKQQKEINGCYNIGVAKELEHMPTKHPCESNLDTAAEEISDQRAGSMESLPSIAFITCKEEQDVLPAHGLRVSEEVNSSNLRHGPHSLEHRSSERESEQEVDELMDDDQDEEGHLCKASEPLSCLTRASGAEVEVPQNQNEASTLPGCEAQLSDSDGTVRFPPRWRAGQRCGSQRRLVHTQHVLRYFFQMNA